MNSKFLKSALCLTVLCALNENVCYSSDNDKNNINEIMNNFAPNDNNNNLQGVPNQNSNQYNSVYITNNLELHENNINNNQEEEQCNNQYNGEEQYEGEEQLNNQDGEEEQVCNEEEEVEDDYNNEQNNINYRNEEEEKKESEEGSKNGDEKEIIKEKNVNENNTNNVDLYHKGNNNIKLDLVRRQNNSINIMQISNINKEFNNVNNYTSSINKRDEFINDDELNNLEKELNNINIDNTNNNIQKKNKCSEPINIQHYEKKNVLGFKQLKQLRREIISQIGKDKIKKLDNIKGLSTKFIESFEDIEQYDSNMLEMEELNAEMINMLITSNMKDITLSSFRPLLKSANKYVGKDKNIDYNTYRHNEYVKQQFDEALDELDNDLGKYTSMYGKRFEQFKTENEIEDAMYNKNQLIKESEGELNNHMNKFKQKLEIEQKNLISKKVKEANELMAKVKEIRKEIDEIKDSYKSKVDQESKLFYSTYKTKIDKYSDIINKKQISLNQIKEEISKLFNNIDIKKQDNNNVVERVRKLLQDYDLVSDQADAHDIERAFNYIVSRTELKHTVSDVQYVLQLLNEYNQERTAKEEKNIQDNNKNYSMMQNNFMYGKSKQIKEKIEEKEDEK